MIWVALSVQIEPDDFFTYRNITSRPSLWRVVPSIVNDVTAVFINELHCSWPATWRVLKTYLCNSPGWININELFLIKTSTLALKHRTLNSICKFKLYSSRWVIRVIISFLESNFAQLHLTRWKLLGFLKSRPLNCCI